MSPDPGHHARPKLAAVGTLLMGAMMIIHLGYSYVRADRYDPALAASGFVSMDQDLSRLPRSAAAPGDTFFLGYFDFDDGAGHDPQGWVSLDRTAGVTDFGDFAGLDKGANLVQEDPCRRSAISSMWGFFHGSPDNYACGAFPGQPAVPYGNPTIGYIQNEIVSPAIALAPNGARIEVGFAVYRDLPLENLVFYTVRSQSITAQGPGPWRDTGAAYYGDGEDWLTHRVPIGHLIDPGADSLRVAIGVVDMADAWGGILGSGACHSQAPLIDEVWIHQIEESGPRIYAEPIDLFQDNFAADGTIDGTVRVDAARDINPRTSPSIRPGDSMVVWVGDPEHGLATASGSAAVYLYVRVWPDRGQLGDAASGNPARWPVTDGGGSWARVQMDSIRSGPGAGRPVIPGTEGRFCVDLAADYFSAGDTIAFYVGARNANGRWSYWSEFTATTSDPDQARSRPSEMTCLPAGGYNRGGDILYVDDFDGRGAQPFFDTAFMFLGIYDRVDRYDVRGADRFVGNGPGSRVVDVSQQLVGAYRRIIWSSGDLVTGTIGDGTGTPEKSPDAQMLSEFLDTTPGPAGVYITGDAVAYELSNRAGAAGLRQYIDYSVTSREAWKTGLGTAPLGVGAPGGMFEHTPGPDLFVVYGGCPKINRFDVLSPLGGADAEMMYGAADATTAAIISQRSYNDRGAEVGVILSGFNYHYIRDAAPAGVPARVHHLDDILTWLRNPPGPPCSGAIMRVLLEADQRVRVTWRPGTCTAPPFEAFRVFRGAMGDSVLISGDIPADSLRYVDETPIHATANTYRVYGRYAGSTGWIPVGPIGRVFMPANVTAFRARPGEAGVDLSWTLEGPHALMGFRVLRKVTGGTEWGRLTPNLLPPSARSFTDRTARPGERYEYALELMSPDLGPLTGWETTASPVVSLTLQQNYPNPFNPSTTIGFTVATRDRVTIVIYDVAGRRVRALYDAIPPFVGYHEVPWDGTSDAGDIVGSGVYFYRMTAPGLDTAKRMVMVR